ncbi:MAG: glutamine amidotransferase family protein [Verrucomicrobiota bacterium]
MCGIAAFFAKTPACEDRLGELFSPMLSCLSGRGPDSAGFALYRDPAPAGCVKVVLQHPQKGFPWRETLERFGAPVRSHKTISTHCVAVLDAGEDAFRQWLEREHPAITLMSAGELIEIYKETGLPCSVLERFQLATAKGSHAIGHTRMATESAVTTAGSHPFSTGRDLCLVHNGSLSTHNRLRLNLRREGVVFRTDNDSEVAAGYLTWRLRRGDSLEDALTGALRDLDGFFTFAIGTRDGFAVLRDPIACKPAVMAETDDYVAMASEYRSLAHLPGVETARLWEPEPGRVFTWSKAAAEIRLAA